MSDYDHKSLANGNINDLKWTENLSNWSFGSDDDFDGIWWTPEV